MAENPYNHLTSIPEVVEETFKFLENVLQKKSKLLEKAKFLKGHLYSLLDKEIKKKKLKDNDINVEDKTNVDNSDIFIDVMTDKRVKAKRTNNEGFRFRRKNVFLTYSKADNEPDIKQVFKEIKNIDKKSKNPNKICNNIDFMLVVKELHQDGVSHFHVFIQFFEQLDRSDPRLFDVPSLKHPEIVYVNNVKRVIKYMCKHIKTDDDRKKNLLEYNMDHRFYLDTVCEGLDTLGYKLINKIITPIQAIKENPKLFFKADTLFRNHNLYQSELERINNKGKPLVDISIGNIDLNPLKFTFNPYKKKRENPQFWICGNSNSGKTYNIEQLELQGHRGYLGTKDNDWDGYKDEHWDFVYYEEYSGENTIQFMNQFLEGTKMDLKVKYGSKVRKNKNLPVFINSNMFPHEAYKNVTPEKLNLLLQRMYVIYLAPDQSAHILWDPSKNNSYDLYDIQCCSDFMVKDYMYKLYNKKCKQCNEYLIKGDICDKCKDINESKTTYNYYDDLITKPSSYLFKYNKVDIVNDNVNINIGNSSKNNIDNIENNEIFIPDKYKEYESLIRQFGSFEAIPEYMFGGVVPKI